MNAPVRHIVTDFASSVVMALSIGLITSVALASAVVLIAEESGSAAASDTAQILGQPAGESAPTSTPGGG